VAFAQEEYKCIWRNPERTMVRIFPEALDYKTITKEITTQQLKQIEEKAGKLLAGQREVFQYYELMSGENSLGYILTSTQKGEYGAIEFVFGIDQTGKIISLYIQRSRERDREFKKKEFLALFTGKTIEDIETLEYTKTIGTQAIVSGIKKELTAFEILK
jgi:Na+-translocating ferredoxin:NAD+ oxidoreductase RnfG subunit